MTTEKQNLTDSPSDVPSGGDWQVLIDGQARLAPSKAILSKWFEEGRVPRSALVWHSSLSDWTPVSELQFLKRDASSGSNGVIGPREHPKTLPMSKPANRRPSGLAIAAASLVAAFLMFILSLAAPKVIFLSGIGLMTLLVLVRKNVLKDGRITLACVAVLVLAMLGSLIGVYGEAAVAEAKAADTLARTKAREAKTVEGREYPVALRASQHGEWQEALKHYETIIATCRSVPEMQSEYFRALVGKGFVQTKLGDSAGAAATFEAIPKLDWSALPSTFNDPQVDNVLASVREDLDSKRQAELERRQEAKARLEQAAEESAASSSRGGQPESYECKSAIKDWIKENVADPDAELMDFGSPSANGAYWVVVGKVRGKNAFGGPVLKLMTFYLQKGQRGYYEVKMAR